MNGIKVELRMNGSFSVPWNIWIGQLEGTWLRTFWTTAMSISTLRNSTITPRWGWISPVEILLCGVTIGLTGSGGFRSISGRHRRARKRKEIVKKIKKHFNVTENSDSKILIIDDASKNLKSTRSSPNRSVFSEKQIKAYFALVFLPPFVFRFSGLHLRHGRIIDILPSERKDKSFRRNKMLAGRNEQIKANPLKRKTGRVIFLIHIKLINQAAIDKMYFC